MPKTRKPLKYHGLQSYVRASIMNPFSRRIRPTTLAQSELAWETQSGQLVTRSLEAADPRWNRQLPARGWQFRWWFFLPSNQMCLLLLNARTLLAYSIANSLYWSAMVKAQYDVAVAFRLLQAKPSAMLEKESFFWAQNEQQYYRKHQTQGRAAEVLSFSRAILLNKDLPLRASNQGRVWLKSMELL